MRIVSCLLCGLIGASGSIVGAQAPPAKVDIVSVAGCLREQPAGEWRIVNATDPKPSNANAPAPADLPAMPVVGKNQFRLIGVAIFDLPSLNGHTVVAKGLLIPDKSLRRLNMTSVVSVASSCAAAR